MSTTSARRGRGGSVVDFGGSAPGGGEYQLTELKNVSTRTADFEIRLVQAVREHPCFYDARDENFGPQNRAAAHRQQAWNQVVRAMGYNGQVINLSNTWKKLKDKFIEERRKGGPVAGEEPLEDSLLAEMAWLDEYVMERMPSSSAAASDPTSQLFFMEGEEDLLGDDFVDQHEPEHEYQVENRLEEVQQSGTSPTGSAHSGNGSDIDVGGATVPSSHVLGGQKDLPGTSTGRGDTVHHGMANHGGAAGSRAVSMQGSRHAGGGPSYRILNPSSSSHHPSEGITVSNRGNGALIAHPKREGSVGGGSTLTMVIDPTTYYQNGTQKMYRLVNVADLDQSQHHSLQHLRPTGGMGGGGATLIAEPHGYSIGRGTRKRMGAPLSPPSHSAGGMLGAPSSSVDHSSLYGKTGQLGDDLILDDGIVGENTIVIDQQRDDESPLLVDSPGMHHHHLMMGGSSQRGMHRGQHSPTLLGNGSSVRGAGSYSPGLNNQGPNPFNTSQYDADLALQHFISSNLARMNEDDKALAKMNIQRILTDARFGPGTSHSVCMGEEDAELTDAAVASEMISGE
ncbi:hypothetical protein PENTCL1PPCAC_10121 [Pristionchus entomophagus]|uniref:MADF domain-containing protein n=1 Tax=Pristionchus entomophagus TaxID=358040 RepID=A0AAV5SXL4_9BILA|nr:hypothetical protein PENTCL1PPCAC_10121 [Pristionchus entomophagus]